MRTMSGGYGGYTLIEATLSASPRISARISCASSLFLSTPTPAIAPSPAPAPAPPLSADTASSLATAATLSSLGMLAELDLAPSRPPSDAGVRPDDKGDAILLAVLVVVASEEVQGREACRKSQRNLNKTRFANSFTQDTHSCIGWHGRETCWC